MAASVSGGSEISGIQQAGLCPPVHPLCPEPTPLDALMTISSVHSTPIPLCTHPRSLLIAKSDFRAWPTSVMFLSIGFHA